MYVIGHAKDHYSKGIAALKFCFGCISNSWTLQRDLTGLRRRNELHAFKFDITKTNAADTGAAAHDLHGPVDSVRSQTIAWAIYDTGLRKCFSPSY